MNLSTQFLKDIHNSPWAIQHISSRLKQQHMAQIASIEEFVCRYFSLQQTALVDNMLYEDRHMDMLNSLHNFHFHTVDLSSGTFRGTHKQLMDKKATILDQLQHRRNASHQKDVERLECDVGKERTVYEWYAVPYWIARYMIDSNEVVLAWRDCYWWGRSSIVHPLAISDVVKRLYQHLSASP